MKHGTNPGDIQCLPSFLPSFLPELTRRTGAALAVAVLAAATAPAANAALQGRNFDGNAATFEAYYDTALNITWLADANYAKTSGYAAANSSGGMTWDEAQTWAANLNVNGVTGWRLPTLVDTGTSGCNFAFSGTDCGYNVSTSTSEMAHLYFVTLGNKAYYDTAGNGAQSGWGLSNTGPFSNVQSYVYWSGVEYAPDANGAWTFGTSSGSQGNGDKVSEFAAWAVRPGDVAAVPEPQTYALALAGLATVLLARQRRHA